MKTIKNTFLLFALLILSTSTVKAQDFKGNWDGKLIVTMNGEETFLAFRMVINTDGLGNCDGASRLLIPYNGKSYYAQYSFKGTYSGTALTFNDVELLESDGPSDPDFYWCKKSGTLYLYNNTLTGSVTGYSPRGDCMPAKAKLDYHSALE